MGAATDGPPPTGSQIRHVLREAIRREEFTRDRVGAPGCAVRLDAAHNAACLSEALRIVDRSMTVPARTKQP